MPRVSFGKYEGLGNDFVIIEDVRITSAAAVRLCDRRRGIGADGVLTLVSGPEPEMLIQNSDGSIAEMCGNGLRCVVQRLCAGGSEGVRIRTGAGVLAGRLEGDDVRVELGAIRIIDEAVEANGRMAMSVSLGNPHLVLPEFSATDDLMSLARAEGPKLERHPRFADRTNVEFLKRTADGIELVVFERGAGITDACGTGAAAAAFVSAHRKTVPGPSVRVMLPGGALTVHLGETVEIVGPARHVFDGSVELSVEEIA